MKTNLTELKRATTFENFNLCSLSSQTLWIVRYIPEILYRQGCEIDNISHPPEGVKKTLFHTPPPYILNPSLFKYYTLITQISQIPSGVSPIMVFLFLSLLLSISVCSIQSIIKLSSDKLSNLVDYCLLMTDYCYSYWLLAIDFL